MLGLFRSILSSAGKGQIPVCSGATNKSVESCRRSDVDKLDMEDVENWLLLLLALVLVIFELCCKLQQQHV